MTVKLEDLVAKGVFDNRDDKPTYTTIHTKRKERFCTPKASQLFTQDAIADFAAVARGRIIASFASHATPHRGKIKPRGYITGVDCKLSELVNYVVQKQSNRPIVITQQLPEQYRKQTSGKIRQILDSLTREFVTLAMRPLYESQDIWFLWQNGGEWHIAPHCINELPRVKSTLKRKDVEEDSAA